MVHVPARPGESDDDRNRHGSQEIVLAARAIRPDDGALR
jgi:hypothetical protein